MKSGLPVIFLTRKILNRVVRRPIIEVVRSRLFPLAALGVALLAIVPAAATTIVPAADPGELANLAGKPEAREVLLQHRGHLRDFARKHGDKTAIAMLRAVDAPEA